LSTLPNCPECVAREKKALKKQHEMEAVKAEEEGKIISFLVIEI